MATTVPPPSTPGVETHFLSLPGASGVGAHVIGRFKLPYATRLSAVSAVAAGLTGTTPTAALDVEISGDSVLTAPLGLSATTIGDAALTGGDAVTPARPLLADEAELALTVTLGGTTPAVETVWVMLTTVRV